MMRLLFCLPLLLAGCVRDADPLGIDGSAVQVFAVLEAGADSATILISRPARDPSGYIPVSGAEVTLVTPAGTAVLTERADGAPCAMVGRFPVGNGSGCYSAALPAPIQPGSVYDLQVSLPGGGTVFGTTRVPAGVQFTTAPSGPTYTIECPPVEMGPACSGRFLQEPPFGIQPLAVLELTWEAPPGAARVDALFRPIRVVNDGVQYSGERCEVEPPTFYRAVPADRGSVRWPVHSIYCFGPLDVLGWDTLYVAGTVAVYDSAYHTYLDAVLDRDAARIDAVSAGLEGALGVFGSVNARRQELTLVRVERQSGGAG